MVKSSDLFEAEVGDRLARLFAAKGLLTLTRLRLTPYELDVVLFDPTTLLLTSIEIKRRNWRALLAQALRASMYCHVSIVAIPADLTDRVSLDDFRVNGVGVYFYEAVHPDVNVAVAVPPQPLSSPNRDLKQEIYRRFHAAYGDFLYA